jgi:hypothetical protein
MLPVLDARRQTARGSIPINSRTGMKARAPRARYTTHADYIAAIGDLDEAIVRQLIRESAAAGGAM